jgi:hypothetical protein
VNQGIRANPPPVTNRGVEVSDGVTVGLGWLDGSAGVPSPERLVAVMRERFPKVVDLPSSGFYGRAVGFDGGYARVEWMGRANALGTSRVEVKQSALDRLGLAGGTQLLGDLMAEGFRASRVDVWVDDEQRRITPGKVRAAVLDGQAVTHARPGRSITDDQDGRQTYYLGRAGSSRLMRFYDKLDPPRTRSELQARKEMARSIAAGVVQSGGAPAALMGQVVSFVDFRESRGRSDGVRAPRLDWWAAVVGDTVKAQGAPARPRPSIDELAVYLEDAWSRKFAEVVDAKGRGWLERFLSIGRERLARANDAEEWVA